PSKPASTASPAHGNAQATTHRRGCAWKARQATLFCVAFAFALPCLAVGFGFGFGFRLQLLKITPPFRTPADPEGGAHGCAPFFDEGRMPSRKIPSSTNSRVCSWHKAFFFASFLLTPIKRNEVAEGESL